MENFPREKRRGSSEQFIERGTEAVNVIGGIGAAPHRLFRAHVGERSCRLHAAGAALHGVGDASGDAKVHDLQSAVLFIDQQI